jgi:hypothetical protein
MPVSCSDVICFVRGYRQSITFTEAGINFRTGQTRKKTEKTNKKIIDSNELQLV